MAKAILILDEMPKRCFDCKLRLSHIETFCIPTGKTISELWEYTDQKEGRPDWCPLKDLPEPEINNYITDEDWECLPDDYEITAGYAVGHQDGWNDCLNAIEKREVEDEH